MALLEPLDPIEARIFGVLVEKSLTTPDSYPLSFNGLQAGCNQKSNRDPVTDLDRTSIEQALTRLRLHRLVRERHTASARVVKYDHDGANVLEVDENSLAVLTELLLRGPQTPGALRARASRMSLIPNLSRLDELLSALAARGMVEKLPPAPGSRATIWRQLLCPGRNDEGDAFRAHTPAAARAAPTGPVSPGTTTVDRPGQPAPLTGSPAPQEQAPALVDLASRLVALEGRVRRLEARLERALPDGDDPAA